MAATMNRTLASELRVSNYQVDAGEFLTPALAIYPAIVRQNIACMVALLDGQPNRWRPHLKTAKLSLVVKMLVQVGVTTSKCATTLELLVACQAGMRDVLVAYAHTGANARRVSAIAAAFPDVRVSAIVDAPEQIQDWTGTAVDLFIDVNSGMDRTGIAREGTDAIIDLASRIGKAGIRFRGLHFYDGHATEPDLAERTRRAHERYDQLLRIVSDMEAAGLRLEEVITSGTPAIPCALSYPPFSDGAFRHQISPGTVVYNDASSLAQLPEEYGLRPAALVISRVVSHPKANVVTCDAGHKSLAVDSGVPNCLVLGQPSFEALKPSEEHLPLQLDSNSIAPPIGTLLFLIPRHVCPTINNFDFAVLVEEGSVTGVERVSARGHEGPKLPVDLHG